MDSAPVSVGLPIALAIIMFGLGLSLTPADFTRIGRQPKAVVVILLVQVVLLPIVAFALAKGFGLEPGLAVGLMILAASPGGTTANLFSHLFRGDVALNITLTAINSLLALLTLPIVVNLALSRFRAGQPSVGMQASKLLQVFAVVLVPVAIGMLVRAKAPGFADRMDKPVRIASAVLLFLVVIGAILGEEHAMAYIARVGLVTSLFCLLSLTIGYTAPRRPERRPVDRERFRDRHPQLDPRDRRCAHRPVQHRDGGAVGGLRDRHVPDRRDLRLRAGPPRPATGSLLDVGLRPASRNGSQSAAIQGSSAVTIPAVRKDNTVVTVTVCATTSTSPSYSVANR